MQLKRPEEMFSSFPAYMLLVNVSVFHIKELIMVVAR